MPKFPFKARRDTQRQRRRDEVEVGMAEPALLSSHDVKRDYVTSDAGLWRDVQSGRLPEPIKISGIRFWLRSDVDAAYLGGAA